MQHLSLLAMFLTAGCLSGELGGPCPNTDLELLSSFGESISSPHGALVVHIPAGALTDTQLIIKELSAAAAPEPIASPLFRVTTEPPVALTTRLTFEWLDGTDDRVMKSRAPNAGAFDRTHEDGNFYPGLHRFFVTSDRLGDFALVSTATGDHPVEDPPVEDPPVGDPQVQDPPVADPPTIVFGLPIDCVLDTECAILNYVDLDTTTDRADYTCGRRSYDGHKGTDFAIGDELDMAAGVAVRAAAAGTVTAVRDEMDDINLNDVDPATIEGRECGNGVVIDHGDGWVTKYCHMRLASVVVDVGDTLAEGDLIGMVGLSGSTEFPHLHFGVALDDEVVDPFTGPGTADCGDTAGSLWRTEVLSQLPYQPAVINFGFADDAVDDYAIFTGGLDQDMNIVSPALVFFGQVLGVETGNQIQIVILDPNGDVFTDSGVETVTQSWVTYVSYAGRNRTSFWQSGEYTGEVTVTTGAQSITRTATLSL